MEIHVYSIMLMLIMAVSNSVNAQVRHPKPIYITNFFKEQICMVNCQVNVIYSMFYNSMFICHVVDVR